MKAIEELFAKGEMKISKVYSMVKIKTVPEDRLRAIDPGLVSFFNINTQEDLLISQEMNET